MLTAVICITACGDKNKDYLVKIKTEYGDMTVVLYEQTPLHKKNFLELVKSGRYDSTNFHRIMEDFMIQGGNVAEKEGVTEKKEDRVPAEIRDDLFHVRGALAAARQPDYLNQEKMSSSTQFYIVDGLSWEMMTVNIGLLNRKLSEMLKDTAYSDLFKQFQDLAIKRDAKAMNNLAVANRALVEEKYGIDLSADLSKIPAAYEGVGGAAFLDGEYTVFGRVIDGLDVIDKIAGLEKTANPQTGEMSVPTEPIYMTMEVIEMKKKKVTETYGYKYPESK